MTWPKSTIPGLDFSNFIQVVITLSTLALIAMAGSFKSIAEPAKNIEDISTVEFGGNCTEYWNAYTG